MVKIKRFKMDGKLVKSFKLKTGECPADKVLGFYAGITNYLNEIHHEVKPIDLLNISLAFFEQNNIDFNAKSVKSLEVLGYYYARDNSEGFSKL